MKKLFIESSLFTETIGRFLDDEALAALQHQLMEHPEKGSVMKGCGGLRKMRVGRPSRQQGKRGGARVIYLHVPEANWIFLLDIYGKDQKEDLSAAEKKVLKRLAEEFRQQAREVAIQKGGGNLE
jgi:hypothetical protein